MKNLIKPLGVGILFISIFNLGIASEEIVRVQASRATYISSESGFRDYTSQRRMIVGHSTNENLGVLRGWIEFDLTNLPESVEIEGAVLGLQRHGSDKHVNPKELIVIDQGLPEGALDRKFSWDLVDGGDTEGRIVATLSTGVAGDLSEMTPLTTMPTLKTALQDAVQRSPRKLFLLIVSPEAESNKERGQYWRLGASEDSRPVMILQYKSK